MLATLTDVQSSCRQGPFKLKKGTSTVSVDNFISSDMPGNWRVKEKLCDSDKAKVIGLRDQGCSPQCELANSIHIKIVFQTERYFPFLFLEKIIKFRNIYCKLIV